LILRLVIMIEKHLPHYIITVTTSPLLAFVSSVRTDTDTSHVGNKVTKRSDEAVFSAAAAPGSRGCRIITTSLLLAFVSSVTDTDTSQVGSVPTKR
jgi:hypothetical protein